tara:strand:+ start:1476 stop:1715 length:240 start_codon:yes stop_codon:yes gene_type:complete
MEFRQNPKDGSCNLHFNEDEIEIIKKNKKIHFTANSLRHFGNALVRMVMEFNKYFDEETKSEQTKSDKKLDLSKDANNK